MSSVTPPPYPSDFISPRDMYRTIKACADWCYEEEEAIRETPHFELYRSMEIELNIGSEDMYLGTALGDMFGNWNTLRSAREAYDSLLRDFESDWGGEIATARRISILEGVVATLSRSFISAEVRAAQYLEAIEAGRMANDAIQSKMQGLADLARKARREIADEDSKWWDDVADELAPIFDGGDKPTVNPGSVDISDENIIRVINNNSQKIFDFYDEETIKDIDANFDDNFDDELDDSFEDDDDDDLSDLDDLEDDDSGWLNPPSDS